MAVHAEADKIICCIFSPGTAHALVLYMGYGQVIRTSAEDAPPVPVIDFLCQGLTVCPHISKRLTGAFKVFVDLQ